MRIIQLEQESAKVLKEGAVCDVLRKMGSVAVAEREQ